jgi:chemotaxis protein MotB
MALTECFSAIGNPEGKYSGIIFLNLLRPMKTKILIFSLCCAFVFIPSCVSKKKYRALDNKYKRLDSTYQSMMQDKKDYEKMSQGELQKLNAQLRADLAALEASHKRVAELQSIIQRQKRSQQELLSKVTNALIGFNSSELTADLRPDGKVYISLSEKLLFKSGKYDVDERGRTALSKLGEVLSKQPDIDIIVEGHTDTVPLKKGANIRDNLDLSVMRATTIVRLLSQEYGVDPKQMYASGRGEHFPVASNTSAAGRQSNRRTEIILAPRYEEFYKLLMEN